MTERNPHVAEPFRAIVNSFSPQVGIRCSRCHVTVPFDKVNLKDRCGDVKCPLNNKEPEKC